MNNILMTGAGGFIGSHLCKLLSQKNNLLTPRSTDLDLTDSNAVDDYFSSHRIDYIVHLASRGARISENATLEDVAKPNIDMFKNLARHVSDKCPMIVTGSGAEYDKSWDIVKIQESEFGQSIPQDPYGYSKYLISKEIERLDHILNLRLFGVYGLNENNSRVTSSIIAQNLAAQDIVLNQNVVFDFIYIDDFCKIVDYFIDKRTREKFINVTPTQSIEILELAKIVNDLSDFKSKIIIKNAGLNKEYTADNSKLLRIMGNFDFTSYEKGMSLLYEAMKNHGI